MSKSLDTNAVVTIYFDDDIFGLDVYASGKVKAFYHSGYEGINTNMSPVQLAMLIAAGLSAAVGQFAITMAYKYAPAKKLSVFDYFQVIFAALWGILFLHEVPTALSIIGYVIIIGVAVVRWRMALLNEK